MDLPTHPQKSQQTQGGQHPNPHGNSKKNLPIKAVAEKLAILGP
jgi:hypothetical protein